jgi:hypothetical protein
MKRTPRLTAAEWRAVCEALTARLAGTIEDVDDPAEVYESALHKLQERTQRSPRP